MVVRWLFGFNFMSLFSLAITEQRRLDKLAS